jgi:hypothetical protein
LSIQEVLTPYVKNGKVYYTEITQEEAARYGRRIWRRMHPEEARKAS